jgi:Fe-S-cluster containining protein
VPVNGSDVRRLMRGLLLPIEAFAELLPVEDSERGSFRLAGGEQHWSLHLYRHDDGACALLVGLQDGTERCGAYAHRPGSCRAYPAVLDDAGEIGYRDDAICPPGGCGWNAMATEVWREALVHTEAEWEVYERVLDAWNARVEERPATVAAFYGWLAETYRRIDDLWAGADPAAPPGDLPALLERAGQIAGDLVS